MEWESGAVSPHIPLSGPAEGPWGFTTEPDANHYYSASGQKSLVAKLYRICSGEEEDRCTLPVATSQALPIIIDTPPISIPGPDKFATVGQVVHFNGSASYDPDGTIIAYEWMD